MLSRIKDNLIPFLLKCTIKVYRAIYLPIRVFQVRRKKVINVAFVLSDLGKWKTESLYIKMIDHIRFNPIILVTPYINRCNSGLTILCDYLDKKGYKYHVLDKKQKIRDFVKPDIIFYQEPYNRILDKNKRYKKNLKSLFCYVSYGFHTHEESWYFNMPLIQFAWQFYFENDYTLNDCKNVMINKGKNCISTGLPFTDLFIMDKKQFSNPWKSLSHAKKRIIWAPHYTVLDDSIFHYSTFLKYCDFMLELAKKYKNSVQFAFKPHPVLLSKLYEKWGKEKTDEYYSLWANGENTQLITGEYIPLFMYSDALIHDCGSFTIEYHYTKKLVMYLIKDEKHAEGLNDFGKKAFDLHYKGKNEDDIEGFINNVINGKDEMKEARIRFYNDYLLPPNGKSPSENIINAILG